MAHVLLSRTSSVSLAYAARLNCCACQLHSSAVEPHSCRLLAVHPHVALHTLGLAALPATCGAGGGQGSHGFQVSGFKGLRGYEGVLNHLQGRGRMGFWYLGRWGWLRCLLPATWGQRFAGGVGIRV